MSNGFSHVVYIALKYNLLRLHFDLHHGHKNTDCIAQIDVNELVPSQKQMQNFKDIKSWQIIYKK